MSNASSKPKNSLSPQPGWNPWLGIFFVIFVFYCAQLLAGGLLGGIYPWLRGWSSAEAAGWLHDALSAQIAYLVTSTGLVLGALYMFVRPYGRAGWQAVGLRRPRWSDGLAALGGFPIYLLLFILVVSVIRAFVPELNLDQKQELGFDGNYTSMQLLWVFVSLVILPPISEELLFRGFLYSSFKKAFRLFWAITLTSALFAAGHLLESSSGLLYIAGIDTFILSLVLIWLREKTNGLWASMGLHAIKNGIAFVTLFVLNIK